ncbi:hypothetical protein [Kitasatospora sp. NPDC047058]|uniref:hypothetical protein n=1 Tax=Kitasatospora sp. NPDC047058 TaxID=3155620 RepID=UPI003405379B
MTRPFVRRSATGIRLQRLMAVALMTAALGACMSSRPDSGKDDPLPVQSRQEALDRARRLLAHVADSTGIRLNSEPEEITFTSCVGKNGEPAPDDRFTLLYFVHSDVPGARQNEVVRSTRDMLTKEGLKIITYREASDTKPYAALSARHPESRYVTGVDSTSDVRMALSVTTPCLMPPAASPTTTPAGLPAGTG